MEIKCEQNDFTSSGTARTQFKLNTDAAHLSVRVTKQNPFCRPLDLIT